MLTISVGLDSSSQHCFNDPTGHKCAAAQCLNNRAKAQLKFRHSTLPPFLPDCLPSTQLSRVRDVAALPHFSNSLGMFSSDKHSTLPLKSRTLISGWSCLVFCSPSSCEPLSRWKQTNNKHILFEL